MLSVEMERFYKRWKKKANGYNISELEGCFDKFITLFIIYNFLFNKVAPRRIGDKIKATEKVLSCIEAEYLNQELFKNEKTGEAFANLIEKMEDFSFHRYRISGKTPEQLDKELFVDLKDGCVNKKMKALLLIIYLIRCNMFHGSKDFEDRQESLLKPSIILLNRIVEILHGKLSENTSEKHVAKIQTP